MGQQLNKYGCFIDYNGKKLSKESSSNYLQYFVNCTFMLYGRLENFRFFYMLEFFLPNCSSMGM